MQQKKENAKNSDTDTQREEKKREEFSKEAKSLRKSAKRSKPVLQH